MPADKVIKVRRNTAANAASSNPVLAAGEVGYETDTKKLKVGDGSTAWSSLSEAGSGTYAQKSATWATGVDYVVDERVINSGTSASTTAHTSGASFDAGNFTAIAT